MHSPPKRVLIIEHDQRRSYELGVAIAALGVPYSVVADGREGWRSFVDERPTHVIAALHCPNGPSGVDFLRKLNTEFMGTMPSVYLSCTELDIRGGTAADPTGYMLWPVAASTLRQILVQDEPREDTPRRQATRLRDLYELSLLGPDLIRELDQVVMRTAMAFQVSDCIVWGPSSEPHWPRSSREWGEGELAIFDAHCRLAAEVGSPLFVSKGMALATEVAQTEGYSLIAASMGPVGEEPLTGIAVICNQSRHFTSEEIDALRVLARRLSDELAWTSAHNRLLDEHARLRQTALLDPMLGVWTRPALEQAIVNHLGSGDADRPDLALLLFDYVQLRGINDRYGHTVGDAVLAHFASVLSSTLRPQDQIGRFGGDELAILLVGTDLEEANLEAQRAVAALEESPYRDEDLEIPMRVHAGVTVVAEDESSADGAFARAISAKERARRKNRTLAFTDPKAARASSSDEGFVLGDNQESLIAAGSTLGGMYRILHEISRGSMGVVYRGEDLGLGRPVAIKVLRSDLAYDKELVAKFRSEAALLASLRHRNLVQVYSFGSEGEQVYFVMELVEGEPLSALVHRLHLEGQSFELNALGKAVEEIAEALDELHSVGIVHRDVKPDNILIDRINDRAVLVDVGIARRPEDARDAAGTPGYSAPESFMETDETPATDVYGLASTAYSVLTGQQPYQGDSLVEIVDKQLSVAPPLPSAFRNDLGTAVDSVLLTAMAGQPAKRYRSAGAFAIAFTHALSRSPSAMGSPGVATTMPMDPPTTPQTMREKTPSTYRLSVPSTLQPTSAAEAWLTRGANFRVAALFLGHKLGRRWVHTLGRANKDVAELLKPTLAPESWHPTEHFLWVLRCADGYSDDSMALMRRLGASLMSATLARFFGADLTTQSPGSLLKAAESYWKRYHNWGRVQVALYGDREATVELYDGPNEPLFCALWQGAFRRIAELTGADGVRCVEAECQCRGDSHCRFVVQWQERPI